MAENSMWGRVKGWFNDRQSDNAAVARITKALEPGVPVRAPVRDEAQTDYDLGLFRETQAGKAWPRERGVDMNPPSNPREDKNPEGRPALYNKSQERKNPRREARLEAKLDYERENEGILTDRQHVAINLEQAAEARRSGNLEKAKHHIETARQDRIPYQSPDRGLSR